MFEIPLLAGSKCQFFHQARAESPDVEPQGREGLDKSCIPSGPPSPQLVGLYPTSLG